MVGSLLLDWMVPGLLDMQLKSRESLQGTN